ncbi:50S ribosomal protein L29 [Candidatus Woesearchaeota archaeon]|nr:50S ribosomal protein L29 [Candidatus Woesearchaeota archaeon]
MAIIKKTELKQMNEKSLKEKMNDLKKELIKINSQRAIGTIPEKPGRIKEIKRTIARIYTHLNLKKQTGGNQKV